MEQVPSKTARPTKSVQVVRMSRASDKPEYPKMTATKSGWVTYGDRNMFPMEIVTMNSNSPVNKAIIASKVTYICGKGVRDSAEKASKYVGRPSPTEKWDPLIKRIARDYVEFGGFYLQVILNEDENSVTLYHQDFTTIRIGEVDEETGKVKNFRLSNDWTKTAGKWKPAELPAWDKFSEMKAGQQYLFWYWDYEPALPYYCVPDYYAAAKYIKADGALGDFYNNSLDNGFMPSAVISMPTDPIDEVKDNFQREMEDAFCGSKGASKVVVLWGEEGAKPTIEPFNGSANADIYNNVEGIVFQKIISSHRLASPTLAGVSGSGNLSGNAAEIIDAYVLYNYTVITEKRQTILDALNIFTTFNKTASLVIDDLDVLPAIRATESDGAAEEPIETQKDALATLSKKKPAFMRKLLNMLNLWK